MISLTWGLMGLLPGSMLGCCSCLGRRSVGGLRAKDAADVLSLTQGLKPRYYNLVCLFCSPYRQLPRFKRLDSCPRYSAGMVGRLLYRVR